MFRKRNNALHTTNLKLINNKKIQFRISVVISVRNFLYIVTEYETAQLLNINLTRKSIKMCRNKIRKIPSPSYVHYIHYVFSQL